MPCHKFGVLSKRDYLRNSRCILFFRGATFFRVSNQGVLIIGSRLHFYFNVYYYFSRPCLSTAKFELHPSFSQIWSWEKYSVIFLHSSYCTRKTERTRKYRYVRTNEQIGAIEHTVTVKIEELLASDESRSLFTNSIWPIIY